MLHPTVFSAVGPTYWPSLNVNSSLGRKIFKPIKPKRAQRAQISIKTINMLQQSFDE
jgi:hypothetical protein